MRRRAVLRAGLAGLAGAGLVGARGGRGAATTETPAAYAPLGRLELQGARDCRVSADGETTFVAVGDGFAAVSVPDLSVLAEVRTIEADREGGPLADVADVALEGDRLLVAGPANPQRDQLAGFALFDVADPTAPEQVAFHAVPSSIHNATLAGGRAYLTDALFLIVVDVTGDDPVELGRWSLAESDPAWSDVPPGLRVLHDVRVRGDLTVLSQWDAGTFLVDATDIEDVTVIGRAGGRPADELAAIPEDEVAAAFRQLPGNHHSSALSADGSLLAVGAEAFADEGDDGQVGPGGLDLYDVADPASPTHLSSIDPPPVAGVGTGGFWTTAHDFAFDGDRLFSAWYQGGVRIHDVAEPTAPVELAWWRRPTVAAFWTALPAAGDSFVAPSTTLPGGDLFPGVYRFPNRPGEQADPPSLTEPSPTPTRASPTDAPTPSPTRTPSPTPTSTSTASATPTRSPGQSGFGAGAALGGLAGLAAWRRRRRGRR